MASKINNKDLPFLAHWGPGVMAMAVHLANSLRKTESHDKAQVVHLLRGVAEYPETHTQGYFAPLAQLIQDQLARQQHPQQPGALPLLPAALPYAEYGAENIEPGAREQMNLAMRLPIALEGALMPDAHQGYGLPIGGVLATRPDAVIPYAVGVDIACRMCLSIYDVPASRLVGERDRLRNALVNNTLFGTGAEWDKPEPHDVLDLPEWGAVPAFRQLRDRAHRQLGTSGTGNHFVEFGTLHIADADAAAELGLPAGSYVALLSHSGSRGFGATIANRYTKLAIEANPLPKEARNLAWLDLGTQAGQEYWIGMNLAGEYASACHHVIHRRISRALGWKPMRMVENHHNFAWRETLPSGVQALVHRKGATPAQPGQLGVIPGSSIHPGYVVRGKGEARALASASHGAGRRMSRGQAFQRFTRSQINKLLVSNGVEMIGGDIDEAPMVYKNIDQVMAFQQDLVEVLASFHPRIVRMADPTENKRRGRGLVGE
jgi:tRNA-splicing ligase RtcB